MCIAITAITISLYTRLLESMTLLIVHTVE